MEHPGVVARNFAPSFHSTFWAFLCISKPPFGRLLWCGHHWKDLFLLRKWSINDANFGQKWWRQKWKKGQGSSRAVTGGTGVNGLMLLQISLLFTCTPALTPKYTTTLRKKYYFYFKNKSRGLGLKFKAILLLRPFNIIHYKKRTCRSLKTE